MKWIGQHIWDFITRFRSNVYIEDDANLNITTTKGTVIDIDIDEDVFNTDIFRALMKIYYDKSHALPDSTANINTGLQIQLQDTATNSASSSSALYGATIALNHTSAQGDVTKIGLTISTGGESDTSNTYGIITNIADGGTDIRINSSATTSDHCTIKTGANGATTIETTDHNGTLGHFEIAANGNITLDADGDIALEAGGNDITMDTDNLHLTSSTQYYPQLTLEGTETTTGTGPAIRLKKNGADSVNGEVLGNLQFIGDTSNGNEQSFANIVGSIEDVDFGNECGQINLQVAHEGTPRDAFVAAAVKDATSGDTNQVNVTIANAVGSTTTIAGNLTVNSSIRGKSIYVETCNFSDNLGTTEHFIPFVTASENTAFTNVAVPWIAPAAGKLLKVHWRSSQHCNISSNEMSFRLYKISDGTRWSGTNESLLGTKVVTGPSRLTHAIADFTSGLESGAGSETNAFAANDILGVSIQHSQAQGVTEKVTVTLVFELDFSSY